MDPLALVLGEEGVVRESSWPTKPPAGLGVTLERDERRIGRLDAGVQFVGAGGYEGPGGDQSREHVVTGERRPPL